MFTRSHPVIFHWSRPAASLACRMNCFRFMQLAALFVFTVSSRAADPTFAGPWESTYGHMELKVDGTAVRGTFQAPGGAANDIRGTLDGLNFTFNYTESTGDKGTAEFKLAEDGTTFIGTWQVTKSKQGGAWEGTRVKPVAGRTWLVVLEAHWESSLQQPEYSYGDMLRQFFTRVPGIAVRHRYFDGKDDFAKWCAELPYLNEPAISPTSTSCSPAKCRPAKRSGKFKRASPPPAKQKPPAAPSSRRD